MKTGRFPLVGSITTREAGLATSEFGSTDQIFINCFPEVVKNPITGAPTVVLNKRLGFQELVASVQASATGSYGAVVWTGKADATSPVILSYVKSTGTSVMFFNQSTQIGSDVGSTNRCSYMDETVISGTANLTATLRDSGTSALEAWFFPEGGSWTQITDGDFPSGIGVEHAHMDGSMFVMSKTTGRIHNSDLNSLSAWTAGNFIQASPTGEPGVGCVRYGKYIVGFSKTSLGFFYNAGNSTGSVLSRVQGADIRIGMNDANNGVGRSC